MNYPDLTPEEKENKGNEFITIQDLRDFANGDKINGLANPNPN
jgi:hypothetical protein